jgi:hypothetical protein
MNEHQYGIQYGLNFKVVYITCISASQAKQLLYRNYVFVLDLFPILWCQSVFGLRNANKFNSVQFNYVKI